MNKHYIWPHSRKMYPKFTCSCRVEISVGNIHVFCSDVYLFLRRFEFCFHFLVHRFNWRNTKNTPWFFKGTAISAITFHACIFYSARSHVCFFIKRNSRVSLEYQTFYQDVGFFLSIEMCFYIKNELGEINTVNFSNTKLFTL